MTSANPESKPEMIKCLHIHQAPSRSGWWGLPATSPSCLGHRLCQPLVRFAHCLRTGSARQLVHRPRGASCESEEVTGCGALAHNEMVWLMLLTWTALLPPLGSRSLQSQALPDQGGEGWLHNGWPPPGTSQNSFHPDTCCKCWPQHSAGSSLAASQLLAKKSHHGNDWNWQPHSGSLAVQCLALHPAAGGPMRCWSPTNEL